MIPIQGSNWQAHIDEGIHCKWEPYILHVVEMVFLMELLLVLLTNKVVMLRRFSLVYSLS